MQIANDTIVVIENPGVSDEQLAEWSAIEPDLVLPLSSPRLLTSWSAFAPGDRDRIFAAYGVLYWSESPERVNFIWFVVPKFRQVGLGSFMARFATDLATRYRCREITCTINDSQAARKILEAEEFGETSKSEDGAVFTKKLNWQ